MSAQIRGLARNLKNAPIEAEASARTKFSQKTTASTLVPVLQLQIIAKTNVPTIIPPGKNPMLFIENNLYNSKSLLSATSVSKYDANAPVQCELNTVTSQDPQEHSLGNGTSNFTMPLLTFDPSFQHA